MGTLEATPLSAILRGWGRTSSDVSGRLRLLLYIVFVLSGAAGLIYESIWTRYLGLFVGHSAYAQVIVLMIFLGGMSLGALLVGHRSERLRQPLVAYAAVEAAAGVIGLFFHDVFVGATTLAYDVVFPALPNEPTVVLVKWVMASLLILPQSVLLGMTFPLMSAGVLRTVRDRPGHVLGLLYFANSLGAAGGVLLAGFWLVGAVGLPGTLLCAALINLLVAFGTFMGVRLVRPPQVAAEAEPPGGPAAGVATSLSADVLWRALLAVSFGTAIASFIYEIAWIRMLSLVLGSATHSFELMLSAFILGLALGAFWVHRRADRFRDPIRTLGIVQWCMGFAALATLPVYLHSFGWTVVLLRALSRNNAGYEAFGLARYAFSLAVMLPATFCAGMTLPLITRTLLAAGRGERAIGAVYGFNTIGSIAGTALAALVLMPLLGLKLLLVAGAVVDMGLGVMLLRLGARSPRARRLAWASALGVVAAAALALGLNRFDHLVLASGVYRYGRLPVPGTQRVLYYQDGRTASVTVMRDLGNSVAISTNGKPDASLDSTWYRWKEGAPRQPLDGDVSTQVLLPLLTLAHAPGARQAAVIGQGSGLSSHLLLASPALRQLATIEIEPDMIAGSRKFYPANARVFDDPRSVFVLDDAKSYFAAADRRFDLILSEPSNPWVSGVSGLFTTEFYARVRRYLAPNGVFGQWLHLYEINDGLVLGVLSALHQNFPSYEIYLTSGTDLLVVASNRPTLPAPDWGVFALPGVRRDLRFALPFTPAGLDALHLAGRDVLEPVLRRFGAPNSDYFPVLDLGAERARFRQESARGLSEMQADRFDVVDALAGRRIGFGREPWSTVVAIPRPSQLAVGAVLRGGLVPDSGLGELALAARHRGYLMNAVFAAGPVPQDWSAWVADWLQAERDVHGGTAGVADEPFYGRTAAFLDRTAAPAGARAAVGFMHGLAAWDFAQASREADVLLQQHPAVRWLPDDVLRDGATVARLRLGDATGANRVWARLAPFSLRAGGDLRTLLITAHLLDALERSGQPGKARQVGQAR